MTKSDKLVKKIYKLVKKKITKSDKLVKKVTKSENLVKKKSQIHEKKSQTHGRFQEKKVLSSNITNIIQD